MAVPRGVENNESSRFIDYTLATPWETLISDIEKALKQLSKAASKIEISYLDLPYVIEKLKPNSNRNKKDISKSLSIHDPQWISKTFFAKSYLLFSAVGPHFADYSPSAKTSVLSAFTTAVKASGHNNTPVFFTYSVVGDVGHIKELVGYQLHKKASTDSREVRFVRFESYLYDKVTARHELYFFDGIRKIFQKKLSMSASSSLIGADGLSPQHYMLTPDNYRVTAVNSYLYRIADFKALLLERYASNSSGQDCSHDVFSHDFNRLLVSLCGQSSAKSLQLSHMLVKLQYKEQKQSTVIDNDSYSTFLPSKQPPSSWKVSSYFKVHSPNHHNSPLLGTTTTPTTTASGATAHSPLGDPHSTPSTACWMVFCIRKLLVLFVASVHNRREDLLNMDKLVGGKVCTADLIDRATLDSVCAMLSVETQTMLRTVLLGDGPPPGSPVPSSGSGSREKSNSNPSPVAESEEWAEFECREQVDDILALLFESVEVRDRKSRSGSRASRAYSAPTSQQASEDFSQQYSNFYPDSPNKGGLGLTNTNSISEKRVPADVLEAAIGSNSVLDCAGKSDSIGYFMSLFAVLAGCMNGGQNEVCCLAKLWSALLKETHNSWESGTTLQTFTNISDGTASTGDSIEYSVDGRNSLGSRMNIPPLTTIPPSPPIPPRHKYGTYAKYLTASANSVLVSDENKLPICARDLWQDLIDKKKVRDGLNLALPDRGETIVVQKLQMLQFCIAMKTESVIYRFRNNVSPTRDSGSAASNSANEPKSIISPRLYRRLPLTEDTIAMQERISQKVSSDTSKSGKEHPLLKWQIVRPSLISDINAFKAANNGADLSAFCTWYGVTFSPLAPTDSSVTHGVGIAANNSRNAEEVGEEDEGAALNSAESSFTPFSDMQTSIGLAASTLEEIWRTCEGVHCEAQKPLFQAEKEAEKSFAFLEKIPFTHLSSSLLANAMYFVYHILNAKLHKWTLTVPSVSAPMSPGRSAASPDKKGHRVTSSFCADNMANSLASDLVLLKEQIDSAAAQLKLQSAAPAKVDSEVSAIIMLIDSVAGLVEKLENVGLKIDELGRLFQAVVPTVEDNAVGSGAVGVRSAQSLSSDMGRILVALALRDNYIAERDEEVSVLMDFVKAVNTKDPAVSGTHAWHSYDGRELGLPTSKSYSLRIGRSISTNDSSSNSSARQEVDVGRSQSDGGEDAVGGGMGGGSSSSEFEMDAVIEQNFLRVSFKIPESD